MSGSIAVTVNGEGRAIASDSTVADLVAAMGVGPRGIAVARNEQVVPRSTWADAVVRADDRIEILDAAQGG